MVKTAFVILHYGEKTVTAQCVQSILNMEKTGQAAIVIVDNDNDTEDGLIEDKWKSFLAEECRQKHNFTFNQSGQIITFKSSTELDADEISGIHILKSIGDQGFSHANNLGYRYARNELGASTILVLNNDIIFCQTDFLEKLKSAEERLGSHIIAPDIRKYSDHEPQNPLATRLRTEEEAGYTIRLNHIARKMLPLSYPLLLFQQVKEDRARIRAKKQNIEFYHTIQENIVPFGACVIFCEPFVRAEGAAFEPETQFYYEEYLLALRCQRKQYLICYDPGLRMLHKSGEATRRSVRSKIARMRFLLENTEASCRIYLRELKAQKKPD